MSAVRPLSPHELEAALDLWEALMAEGASHDPRFSPAAGARAAMRGWAAANWLAALPFPRVMVAEQAGRLVGFASAFPVQPLPVLREAATVRMGDVWVAPGSRGMGTGRALVQALLDAARAAGHQRFEVGTLVADARAVAFWRALGFGDWQVLLRRDG